MPDYLDRRRRPTRPASPAPAPRTTAVHAMLAEGFHDKPGPGESYGAMLAQPAPEPPQPQPRGLEIEPPPWAGKAMAQLPPPGDDPPPQPDALAELKRNEGDTYDPPAPPGPPLVTPPLPRVKIPPPDWRAEEEKP